MPRTTTKLGAIEDKCRPWHHLFAPAVAMGEEWEAFAVEAEEFFGFVWMRQPRVPPIRVGTIMEAPDDSGWNALTVDDLNEDTDREFDWTGVAETTGEDLARLEPETDAGLGVARFDEELLGTGDTLDDGDGRAGRCGVRRAPRTAGTLTTSGCAP